ncbi:hypothetical protein BJV82DRAFT_366840 [Fennellomyces sp. T-0311]|nr:hypothetical protein BJV82DRAFT_366840 [Fennellomyces sp. T-0311]
MLTKLTPHLTHLKMLDHGSNIAFLHVLNACPQLTHFTYQEMPGFAIEEDLGVFATEPVVQETESCINTFPKISHLCLDAMLNQRLRLNPILKRCPNLRTFVGLSIVTSDLEDDMSYNSFSVDFDLLFDSCSKITCIKDALSYGSLQDLDHPTINTDDNEFNGLRHFSVSNVCQEDSVTRHLTESQHTLEYLSISPLDVYDNTIDWSSLLKSLQLPQLRTLTLRHTPIDSATVFTICNQCPALEKLDLVSNGLAFDTSVIQRLHPMNHLRSLKLYRISFKDGLSLVEMLERFPSLENLFACYLTIPAKFPKGSKCLDQLKKLQLNSIKWTNDNGTIDLNEGPAYLFEWFAHHSNVETVALYGVSNFGTWSLTALASMSTLKTLDLELEDELECGIAGEDNLNQFATLLSASVIEKLYIETWWHLPEEIVNKLKKLPLLTNLRAYHRWENTCCVRCSNKDDTALV